MVQICRNRSLQTVPFVVEMNTLKTGYCSVLTTRQAKCTTIYFGFKKLKTSELHTIQKGHSYLCKLVMGSIFKLYYAFAKA